MFILDVLVTILLVGAGGYALAACIRLKREQVLFENKILYPSQCTPENCLDPEGYIAYIVPRMSLFGAVCVVFGIAVLVMSLLKVGIIATTVDLTMGLLTRFYRHTGTISTVTLGLSYMRPVRARGSVTVQARMEKLGRSVAFLNARVFDADGRLCVTATASFM